MRMCVNQRKETEINVQLLEQRGRLVGCVFGFCKEIFESTCRCECHGFFTCIYARFRRCILHLKHIIVSMTARLLAKQCTLKHAVIFLPYFKYIHCLCTCVVWVVWPSLFLYRDTVRCCAVLKFLFRRALSAKIQVFLSISVLNTFILLV